MSKSIRKILSVLDPRQRWQAAVLLVLSLCQMVIETFSIGMAIPVLSSFAGASDSLLPFADTVDSLLGAYDPAQRILIMTGMLVVVFLIRGALVTLISWIRLSYIANVRTSISEKLFTTALMRGYSFHLRQNSATLVRNVISEATKFASLMNSGFLLVSDFLVLCALSILLLLALPVESFSTITILAVTWLLFHFVIGRRLTAWGRIRVKSDGQRLQHTQQGLNAYREVKLLGKEAQFVRFYQPFNLVSARMAKLQSFAGALPRVLFEAALIVAIFVIVLIQTMGGASPADQIAKLGLFAVAAFRILPSVTRLASSYNAIKYGRAVFELVHDGIDLDVAEKQAEQEKVKPLDFHHQVVFENVSFSHANAEHALLRDVDFQLNRGETVGLIGPSGSGKSTMVDLFLGILKADVGRITVDGREIAANTRAWQNCIGYVAQTVFITDDTLAHNIAFGNPDEDIDRERVAEVVRLAHLDELVEEHPLGIDLPLGENAAKLSGGQRQRVGIARALYHDPQILVLDEITSALDSETERKVVQVLEEMHGKKTMMIVSHRHSTLTGCDRVFSLSEGSLTEVDAANLYSR